MFQISKRSTSIYKSVHLYTSPFSRDVPYLTSPGNLQTHKSTADFQVAGMQMMMNDSRWI